MAQGQRGLSLVELMVALTIGLFTTLAITQILLASEGQRHSTAAGADAQANAVLAMDMLRTAILGAGYGFSSQSGIVGCTLSARFNGAAIAHFPTKLIPVEITDGGSAPDAVRVLASSKTSAAVPMPLIDPAYDPTIALQSGAFHVVANPGVELGDLLVAATDDSTPCQVFRASGVPSATQIDRADSATGWNPVGFPSHAYSAANHSVLVNLGELTDVTYSVDSDGNLQTNALELNAQGAPTYSGNADTYTNIVTLKAYYGKASLIDGSSRLSAPIDTWDKTPPTTHVQWLQVLAVRLALVSRSDQYEKNEVTTSAPLWDVGANAGIANAVTCGSSKCVSLPIPHSGQSTDWKHYRYKVVDSIIPLRNMIWTE